MDDRDEIDTVQFYANLAVLERLAAYAKEPSASAPSVRGLKSESSVFLSTPEGAAAAASWLRAFAPTMSLLTRFRQLDLQGADAYEDDEQRRVDLAEALRATETALDAAVSRINFMSTRSRVAGTKGQSA